MLTLGKLVGDIKEKGFYYKLEQFEWIKNVA